MKKLLPLIFVTLLLAGCASQGSTKMTDDQLFQKKQECVGYKEKIEKGLGESSLETIFYSPVRNSCVYIISLSDSLFIREDMYDYLTNEKIGSRAWNTIERCDSMFSGEKLLSCKQKNEQNLKEISDTVEKLKGE
ncbi:MAG: hypothetical protein WCO66_03395 [Candidatus Absconditabacteria bacterium]